MRFIPRWRFSLRTLLVLVTICAILSAWAGRYLYHKRLMIKAIADIGAEGGYVMSRISGPKWQRAIVGDQWFSIVDAVQFGEQRPSDSTLRGLRYLPELRTLVFKNTPVGDEIARYLVPLTTLRGLDLGGTRITDSAILRDLPEYPELESLFLNESQVSENSAIWIHRLPKLDCLVLKGTNWNAEKLVPLDRPAVNYLIFMGQGLTPDAVCEIKAWPELTMLVLNLQSKPPDSLLASGTLMNASRFTSGSHWSSRLMRDKGSKDFMQLDSPQSTAAPALPISTPPSGDAPSDSNPK